MAHLHNIYDSDIHFKLDSKTRTFSNETDLKLLVAQGDHNSERITFEIPRYIEQHDMLKCNRIEIHYINISSTTRDTSKDVYIVDDAQVSPEDENVVEFSWLLSGHATQYNGTLSFAVSMKCLTDEVIDYKWNTLTYEKILVGKSLNNAETIAQEYSDVLEKWKKEVLENINPTVTIDTALNEESDNAIANSTVAKKISQLSDEIDDLKENGVSGGGTVVSSVEPIEDDIPKVYFTGTLPTSKNQGDVKVTIHYKSRTEDFVYPATLKVQGGSSVNYPKKNFTLKMYEDEALENKVKYAFKDWGKLNKFVLKAHWIDHSHVRNVGTAKIWSEIVRSRSDYESLPTELKNSPNNGATDGFTVKVFVNGIYQGLYEWIVPKDKLFGQDDDNVNHSIMNSEWNNQPSCSFATSTPTIEGNWSEELQDSLLNATSISFANFIKFVASSTDEEFVANAENYFDVQSVIDYDIFARVFCIVDNLCRNQIFFKYDTKWYEGVWDLDAVLGLPPTTRGFFAYDTEFQTGYIAYKDYGMTNMLYQRVETLFINRFKARYTELRSNILSIENIIDVYERLTDVIKTYDGLLEEDYASTTGGGQFTSIPYTTENNIQQIRSFVSQRISYMDNVIENMVGESGGENEEDTTVPCTSISLDKTSLSFTDGTSIKLTPTVNPTNTTEKVKWESSSTSIATVSNGVVTPVGNGNCIITATCGTQSATCSVNVNIEVSNYTIANSFEESTWTSGYYNDVGKIVEDSSMYHSELMPITGDALIVGKAAALRISYFDGNKNYIGFDRGVGLGVHPSSDNSRIFLKTDVTNAMYFAISQRTSNKEDVSISFLEELENNRIELGNLTSGKTVNWITGAVINGTGNLYEEYVPVTASEKYTIEYYNTTGIKTRIAFYDENKVYNFDGDSSTNNYGTQVIVDVNVPLTFTVPSGASYMLVVLIGTINADDVYLVKES